MANSKTINRVVINTTCPYGGRLGVTEEVCREMTAKPACNLRHCVGLKCPSPFRICSACVIQGASDVVTHASGLCDFHEENGREACRPKAQERPLWQRLDDYDIREPRAPRAERIDRSDWATDMSSRYEELDHGMRTELPELDEDEPVIAALPAATAESESETSPPPSRYYATPKKDGEPKKVNEQTGTVSLYHPGTCETVRVGMIEALELVTEVHAIQGNVGRTAAAFKISGQTVTNLLKLRKLEPSVRELASPRRPPGERLGFSAAARIADLAPARQEDAAKDFLDGKLSLSDLDRMVKKARSGGELDQRLDDLVRRAENLASHACLLTHALKSLASETLERAQIQEAVSRAATLLAQPLKGLGDALPLADA